MKASGSSDRNANSDSSNAATLTRPSSGSAAWAAALMPDTTRIPAVTAAADLDNVFRTATRGGAAAVVWHLC